MRRLAAFISIFCFVQHCMGQSEHYYFEAVKSKDIDSLLSDSMVRNEFKILNYCYCQYYLEQERIKAFNSTVVKKSALLPAPAISHYGYLGGGRDFSFHRNEKKKSFFQYNSIENLDFKELTERYYNPIVDYIKSTSDMKLMDGYSPMFECFYAVEKMPIYMELRSFLLKNRERLRLFRTN